ncbi:MAG: hypothetical protein ACUVRC_04905 [Desulfotomaculales bacterium]
MPRFVFRLEAVLRHRARREEISSQALAAAQREKLAREAEAAANAGRLEAALEHTSGERIDLLAELASALYRDALRAEKRRLAHEIAAKEALVAERRERLLEARKDRLVLEKMKERQRRLFEAVMRARELKHLDDVSRRSAGHPHKPLLKGGE